MKGSYQENWLWFSLLCFKLAREVAKKSLPLRSNPPWRKFTSINKGFSRKNSKTPQNFCVHAKNFNPSPRNISKYTPETWIFNKIRISTNFQHKQNLSLSLDEAIIGFVHMEGVGAWAYPMEGGPNFETQYKSNPFEKLMIH